MTTVKEKAPLPVLAITMGDVAGVGPEVVAAAVSSVQVQSIANSIVIGDPVILRRALDLEGSGREVIEFPTIEEAVAFIKSTPRQEQVVCCNTTSTRLDDVPIGKLDVRCGAAAFDWLSSSITAAQSNLIDGIVTAPLNKEALHQAGHHYPGHTEILAEKCGVKDFAMMLYLPCGEIVKSPFGLGVAHVTLHTSIVSVPELLTSERISEKVHLVNHFLKQLGCQTPRIGVCALNPHAGENGLFGDEEARIISPAVQQARASQVEVLGPLPADTLLQQAVAGKFDGIVAMYHDQGHIALKLIGFQRAVNVTLGLPIIRTSPSHGTAFDIAWKSKVDPTGMQEAIRIAVQLVNSR